MKEELNCMNQQKTLFSTNQTALKPSGKCCAWLSRGDARWEEDIYVNGSHKKSLLCRRAFVDTLESAEIYKRDHSKLFDSLGKIPVQYEIKLRNDSQPFTITTPRHVSIPLLDIVKSELQQMEDLGVIHKVENPTYWFAGIVVVAKSKCVLEEGDNMKNRRYASSWAWPNSTIAHKQRNTIYPQSTRR